MEVGGMSASHGWWAMERYIDHGPNGEWVWRLCFDPHLPGWPQLFRTRRECRAWIEEHHGYIRQRDDLKAMGWRMPRAVMVSIVAASEDRKGSA
jgi:hypothetical protein